MQGCDRACSRLCPHLSKPGLQCKVSKPHSAKQLFLICVSLTFVLSCRFVTNLALISHKPTVDVKLSGEGSLKSDLPTLHGRSGSVLLVCCYSFDKARCRRMCTDVQSLTRGLSNSSVQKNPVDDKQKAEDDDELKPGLPEDEKQKVSGKKMRKGVDEKVAKISGKPLPEIKVENADKSPKSEVKEEEEPDKGRIDPTNLVYEKGKGRSRSRRRSGLWETILKSPDVKAEPEEMRTEATDNAQKRQSRSKSKRGKPIVASEEEAKPDLGKPVVEQGRGKRKSSSRLVASPPKDSKQNHVEENEVKNSKQSKSEEEGGSKVTETSARRTSKRLSTAPFSSEKLKPEDKVTDGTKKGGKGGGNDSDSDFEPSPNVTPKSAKRGKERAGKAPVTTKRTPKSAKQVSKKQKRAELESDAEDDDFEPPAKKTPKSEKKVWCEQNQWFANSVAPKSGKFGKKSKKVWCDQENHWAEVYLEVEGR